MFLKSFSLKYQQNFMSKTKLMAKTGYINPQKFNILKSHIIISPVLSEILHTNFLETVPTRMVYRNKLS